MRKICILLVISVFLLIGCLTNTEKLTDYPKSYQILSMPNSFADIKWNLMPDFTMQFYIKIMENEKTHEFKGTWKYINEKVFVTFLTDDINLSAIFDWNKKNENNIMIETDRIISFHYNISNLNIYGVTCYIAEKN